jgi:hypothetical protein
MPTSLVSADAFAEAAAARWSVEVGLSKYNFSMCKSIYQTLETNSNNEANRLPSHLTCHFPTHFELPVGFCRACAMPEARAPHCLFVLLI